MAQSAADDFVYGAVFAVAMADAAYYAADAGGLSGLRRSAAVCYGLENS